MNGFKVYPKTPLSDPLVASYLDDVFAGTRMGKIMLHRPYGKRWLKPHRTRDGRLYVRVGVRGSGKRFLTSCYMTIFDNGLTTLFSFQGVEDDA